MSGVYRRIRGALGIGMAWAAAWAAAQLVLVGGLSIGAGGGLTLAALASTATMGGALGFVNGLVFAGAFSAVNQHKAFDEVSTRQTTALGLGAGALFPAAFIGLAASAGLVVPGLTAAVSLLIGMTLGGTTSYGLLRVARSAAPIIEPMEGL